MGLASLVLLWLWYHAASRKRLLENVPTSKIRGVFLGQVEVKGRAVALDPMRSYLAQTSCVYFRYRVEELWSRLVTTRDQEGKTTTSTESGWSTVSRGGAAPSFLLRDRTGELRIDPDGADVHGTTVFDETVGMFDPLYYSKGPAEAVADSDHRRRFTEEAIQVGERVYVFGTARQREDIVAAEIAASDKYDDDVFLISTRSEDQIARRYGWTAVISLIMSGLAAWATVAKSGPNVVLGVMAGFAASVLAAYGVLVHSSLVSVRERAAMARSLIDVQLRRRHVLIPQLAEVVRAAAHYEKTVQSDVAAARASDAASQTQALRSMFALVEAYPDLKSSPNFRQLHDELIDAEDRIALAREFHNKTVTTLNNRIETLPDALIAGLTRFKPGRLFTAESFERTAVRVELDPINPDVLGDAQDS